MKQRLLLIMLILLSGGGPAYGEWVRIATTDQGMTAYVDRTTIHRKGNLVKMWALVDIETSKVASLSRKEKGEYDCEKGRHRLLAGSWFSGHMGQGNVDAIDSLEYESVTNPSELTKNQTHRQYGDYALNRALNTIGNQDS